MAFEGGFWGNQSQIHAFSHGSAYDSGDLRRANSAVCDCDIRRVSSTVCDCNKGCKTYIEYIMPHQYSGETTICGLFH